MNRHRSLLPASLCVAALVSGGCAASVRDAARSATPAAVSGSLEGMSEPQNRERMAELLRDPGIREASGELARSLTAGALQGLTDLERDRKLQLATDAFVDHMGAALARSLRTQIGPEISSIVARSVNESLAAAFSVDNQKRAREFTTGLVPGLVPATQPSGNVADKTDPRADSPAGQLARNLAREAALGVQDAVHESVQKQDVGNKQPGDILAVAGKSADKSGGMLLTLVIAAGVFAAAALLALVWALSRVRRYRLDLNRFLAQRDAEPPGSARHDAGELPHGAPIHVGE